jgi:GSH-dependent disulfide-bond oxidoreductase
VIDLYTWVTPNCQKVNIAVTEMKLKYNLIPVNIREGEQHKPEYLKINPNNKVPAIVDRGADVTLMESGAILLYLAEKTAQLIPSSLQGRWEVVQWVMWQMGGVGPMFGQASHYREAGKAPYAEERFAKEVGRLYSVLDKRLSDREYVCDDYSIADIAIWPWVSRFARHGVDLSHFPNVKSWYSRIAARPAVQKAFDIPHRTTGIPIP